MLRLKTVDEIAKIRESCRLLAETHLEIEKLVDVGITTLELDDFARSYIEKHGGKPAFLNYMGYPASLCTSVNHVVIHGIPNRIKLKEGDIISLDLGIDLKGYFSDAARTLPVGRISPESRELIDVTRECLYLGIEQAQSGNRINHISRAVYDHARTHGMGVVRLYRLWAIVGLLTLALIMTACGGAEPVAQPEPTNTEAPAEEPTADPASDEAIEAFEDAPTPAEEAMVSEHAEETAMEESTMEEPMMDRCGDRAQLADTLHLFNWADYMDEAIRTQFEEECGVQVVEDIFSSNEDMMAKIQAGNSGYDLIIPSDYAIDIMMRNNLLAELDKSNIPNIENLDPNQMGLYYDPENNYSLPFQWGVTGIAYNQNYLEAAPTSWATLFDPDQVCEHSGFVSMLDDEREAVGAALIYLGYAYNDTDPAHHEEAKNLLLAQKECLAGYNSDNYNQSLASEEIVLAQAWTGGAALARAENEAIYFVIPEEGSAIWQDNMAIPVDAPNQYTAEIFMNYLLEPEIGAQLSNYTYFFTPNKAAQPLLDDQYFAILESGGMLLEPSDYDRLEWIERNDDSIIFSDSWTAIKAQ